MSSEQIAERIIVAFDFNNEEDVIKLADQLKGHAKIVKIGMELYLSQGPSIISLLKDYSFKIFLDLKLHDIPNTVYKTTKALTVLGVDIFNVHAAGGLKMLVEAKRGIDEAPSSFVPKLIGVTHLTSTDQAALNNEIGIQGDIAKAVVHYAKLCKEAKLDGVVASPKEVDLIKSTCGDDFLTVTPGIRPKGVSAHDQKRVATPSEAFSMGTDYIVVGRAITQAASAKQAFINIINSVK